MTSTMPGKLHESEMTWAVIETATETATAAELGDRIAVSFETIGKANLRLCL